MTDLKKVDRQTDNDTKALSYSYQIHINEQRTTNHQRFCEEYQVLGTIHNYNYRSNMVQVKRQRKSGKGRILSLLLWLIALFLLLAFIISTMDVDLLASDEQNQVDSSGVSKISLVVQPITMKSESASHPLHKCSYKAISDLKPYEKTPTASKELDGNGRRHMVNPPKDTKITLVCCETTAGPLSVVVHHNWAPLGAERFLDMVKDEYFSSKVALMRCVKNFLCQFGIAGIPSLNKKYRSFKDDPNWLLEGPTHMTNQFGTKRFARGYFAYAGGGKNSRSNQLIVALNDNKRLGGGSPWEVPFGEVVGEESYATLAAISTYYGEKGPKQGVLRREGSSENIAKEFPKLDYMTACVIADEGIL